MFKTRNMLSLLLALMMVFSLAACATTEKDEPATDDAIVEDNTAEDTTTEDTTTEDETTTEDDAVIEDEPATEDEVVEDEVVEDETTDGETSAPVADGELAAFFEQLGANYEMAMLADLDSEMIEAFLPGLSNIALSESLLKMPMMSAVVCEIYLVKCENAEDAAAVEEIFLARKQAQVDGGAWYPESIATWELAEVVVSGNYVALFAHTNAADMAADFDNAF